MLCNCCSLACRLSCGGGGGDLLLPHEQGTPDPRFAVSLRRVRDRRAARPPAGDHGAGCVTRVAGCPWDKEQTFATIAPYTIEEAEPKKVADAIERGDLERVEGTNWVICCCRWSSMPAWRRRWAPSTSPTWPVRFAVAHSVLSAGMTRFGFSADYKPAGARPQGCGSPLSH